MNKEKNIELKDETEWVLVLTTNTQIDAEMYKANLEGAEIPVHLLDQVDTTRMFNVGALAIVKLYVPKEFEELSREIISKIDEEDF